jgi:hypothetical protein
MEPKKVHEYIATRRKRGSVIERVKSFASPSDSPASKASASVRTMVEDAFATAAPEHNAYLARQLKAAEQFANFTDDDWGHAVDVLIPQFAEAAKQALFSIERRPYQIGPVRKPFRAPNAKRVLGITRGRWLTNVTRLVGEFDEDIGWIAGHGAYLAGWWGAADLGWLLAGAMDAGNAKSDEVRDVLMASARGEHEVGSMGRHVTQALMSASDPRGWEFVEKMLIAAQREEGVRQSILESVDESHPQAFRRMLRLVVDEKLARFSSLVRAADTWFGFLWDGASSVKVDGILTRVLELIDSADARRDALRGLDPETAYLALWSLAFDDVETAIAPATVLLTAKNAELRFIGTHLLAQTVWPSATPLVATMLEDSDRRVAARALRTFAVKANAGVDGVVLFDHLERLMQALPKRSESLPSIVWPWNATILDRSDIAAAMVANATPAIGDRLLPYVSDLEPLARASFIRTAAGVIRPGRGVPPGPPRSLSKEERALAIELLGDASGDVRAAAFEAMTTVPLENDEVARLTDLLSRKPSDLRNAAIKRLGKLGDVDLLSAADTLMADESELRRQAGLELLRAAVESNRVVAESRQRVDRYAAEQRDGDDVERSHIDAIRAGKTEKSDATDALGLLDASRLREWPAPIRRDAGVVTPAALACLDSLAKLMLANAEVEVTGKDGEVRQLFVAMGLGNYPRVNADIEQRGDNIPLASVWKAWLRDRDESMRDPDGAELLRLVGSDFARTSTSDAVKTVCGPRSGAHALSALIHWGIVWDPPLRGFDLLLDRLETAIADISDSDADLIRAVGGSPARAALQGDKNPALTDLRPRVDAVLRAVQSVRWWRMVFPRSTRPEQETRSFGLMRVYQNRTGGGEHLIQLNDFLAAYDAGSADESEFLWYLTGPMSRHMNQSPLRQVSTRRPIPQMAERPALLDVVDRVRRRVVEIEATRGERETAVSVFANELRWTGGLETLSPALIALGKTHFARSFSWRDSTKSRQETLSQLVLRSLPRDEDTPEAFAKWAKQARIGEARLLELAVYAPQWAEHVNHVLQWPGLEGAVWWIEAHTKDDRSWQLMEMKTVWAAEISERTPLAAADLTEGGVDVLWFKNVYEEIGDERWAELDKAAKYAASSTGHTRARLFSQALAGSITRDEILERINTSRQQDAVRALGLLPLAEGEAREADLLMRYVRLEDFKREARKFGSQRQQSESRAVAIGLDNLARTAGFRDPQRLRWAMEQRAVADLAKGPIVLTRDDVTATLSIDADGNPDFSLSRNGKPLKAAPASLKKDAEFNALKDRLQDLKRQSSRVNVALEEAMCRGDRFHQNDLRTLVEHPILAPAIARLVFVSDDIAGYVDQGGRVLRDYRDDAHIIGADEEVRIAHPDDLLARGDWSSWQRECFNAERVQPFKQVFRELYPMTETERGTERSRRYAGHQVNPRQALALLGTRGWVARQDEGVSRTFHDEGLTAWLTFQEAFNTPAEVEGLTLADVVFTQKGTWQIVPLDKVPPRVFSEAMRDLDLVVSVAHRGGVDPEATASTVEMRASLVAETCQLLGIKNVELQKHHVIVRGDLATYSIHLGSGGVMVLPGTAIPVVAIHSQHRGRLFLPFADNDPRTAEVLSKVLLFARDKQIRDPNILQWIRATTAS